MYKLFEITFISPTVFLFFWNWYRISFKFWLMRYEEICRNQINFLLPIRSIESDGKLRYNHNIELQGNKENSLKHIQLKIPLNQFQKEVMLPSFPLLDSCLIWFYLIWFLRHVRFSLSACTSTTLRWTNQVFECFVLTVWQSKHH
jgi:hypothetical protein